MRPPAVRPEHPHWTRRQPKIRVFDSFSIFGTLWMRFNCQTWTRHPGKQSKNSTHSPHNYASWLGIVFGYKRGVHSPFKASLRKDQYYLILSLSVHTHLAINSEAKESSSSKEKKGFLSKIRQDWWFWSKKGCNHFFNSFLLTFANFCNGSLHEGVVLSLGV